MCLLLYIWTNDISSNLNVAQVLTRKLQVKYVLPHTYILTYLNFIFARYFLFNVMCKLISKRAHPTDKN
jgi:hypothetical protein